MKKKILLFISAMIILSGITAVVMIIGNITDGTFLEKGKSKAVSAETTNGKATESDENNNGNSLSSENTQITEQQDTESTQETSTQDNDNKIPDNKDVKKVKAKAIYLSGSSAGSSKTLDHYIDVINKTELNAVVIDVKEAGVVNYKSSVPEVENNKLYVNSFDPEKVLKKLHDNNIYVIARIVCFRDNGLAAKIPELGVKKTDGTLWKENNKKDGAWTSAYKKDVWQYNIDIAKEAVEKGFDEIQFDYVRFPTASSKSVYYGSNPPPKSEAIAGFLKLAAEELRDGMGVPVSADVFGIIAESPNDAKNIGQELDKIISDIDYISPMVYPSHYSNAASKGFLANGTGQAINGVLFTAPDLKPYDVVYNTLMGLKKAMSKVEGKKADVRPYLQDFTASYLPKGYYQTYGPEQIKQQIKAVHDAGYEEWIFWDGRNTYTEDGFAKE